MDTQLIEEADARTFRRLMWNKLEAIEAQAVRTNGRISRLEQFRWMSIGALAVVSAIVVPLFIEQVR